MPKLTKAPESQALYIHHEGVRAAAVSDSEFTLVRESLTMVKTKLVLASAPLVGLALLGLSSPAHAVDLSMKLEPGVSIPLSDPQKKIYDVGVSQDFKLMLGLLPYLDVAAKTSFVLLPAHNEGAPTGAAWTLGGGLRLKRPHDAVAGAGLSPWLDADFMYARTGRLDRPAFDVAVGFEAPLGATRTYWVGPFVRYTQIIQPSRDGFDNSDAKILSIGLTIEAGRGYGRTVVSTTVLQPAETITVIKEVPVCADRDNDGMPDISDRCPDIPGPIDNFGCPTYKRLTIKKDKLELNEKLFFAFDKATLEEESFPVLDEVVRALQDNPGFQVQVDGHTDAVGSEQHNQTLSERRAQTVVDYLVAHGIDKSRLVAKGFASKEPIDSNATVEGREKNRRVEFFINLMIKNDGSYVP